MVLVKIQQQDFFDMNKNIQKPLQQAIFVVFLLLMSLSALYLLEFLCDTQLMMAIFSEQAVNCIFIGGLIIHECEIHNKYFFF